MKLCIIKPPLPFGWTPVAPPILEYLAALTRRADPCIEIELVSAHGGVPSSRFAPPRAQVVRAG